MKHSFLSCMVVLAVAASPWAEASDTAFREALHHKAQPFEKRDQLLPLLEAMAERSHVLLGESTHGTAEYYRWRGEISKTLIQDHAFRFVVVEGDWADCYKLNRYVRHEPEAGASAREIMNTFDRWPQWLWANEETAAFIEWLRDYNAERPADAQVGFYGMDLYGLADSMEDLAAYLKASHPALEATAREAIECLQPFSQEVFAYARAHQLGGVDCAEAVQALFEGLVELYEEIEAQKKSAVFRAKLDGLVIKNAENHLRHLGTPGKAAWNARVDHFLETIEKLMAKKGPDGKGIVWAHNTHIGDARATPMESQGSTNIGQLLRERHGQSRIFALGMGTYQGGLLAGEAWDSPRQVMTMPPAAAGSLEALMEERARERDTGQLYWLFDSEDWRGPLASPIGHRAIGVTYAPALDTRSYVPTLLPLRYDGFLFFRQTGPLTPIHP